jgi:hypothetical protein
MNDFNHQLHGWCFGEDQGRVIISTKNKEKVINILKIKSIDHFILGETNKSGILNLNDVTTISIIDIKSNSEKTIPLLMGEK